MKIHTLLHSDLTTPDELRKIIKAIARKDVIAVRQWKHLLQARYALACISAVESAEFDNPPHMYPEAPRNHVRNLIPQSVKSYIFPKRRQQVALLT